MTQVAFALVRGVPQSFADALSAAPPELPIDVDLARTQHAAYLAALASLGLEIVALPSDERFPDCCFVEDTVVAVPGLAVLTRPGASSRRGEVNGVAPALAARIEVVRMEAPATVDGGDCLRLGRTIYVGRSARTNEQGVACLRDVLGPRGYAVVGVPMPPSVLHLKSVCSPLGDDTVLVADDTLPVGTFGGARVLQVPKEEAHAANAVTFAKRALVAADGVRTAALLAREGFHVVPVDTSEMRKADGALTCLSVIVERTRG
jgi:dimethylargininase